MRVNREISPAVNLSVDEYVSQMPPMIRELIARIRTEKEAQCRPRPSMSLIDESLMLTSAKRPALLDQVASLVDENVAGRSDMCLQFAALLDMALKHLGFNSYAVKGIATYLSVKGKTVHSWEHGWVRIGKEVVDGNTDIIPENVMVPKGVKADPYWGPLQKIPNRRLEQFGYVDEDPDVTQAWWPDLREWLDHVLVKID